MFTRRFHRRVHLATAVVTGAFLFGASFAVYALWPSRQSVGYEPDQPFTFPHRIMAGDARIPCRFCHFSVDEGPYAGIPSVQTCMNCHDQIRPKDRNGNIKPDIASLLTFIDPDTNRALRPIPWVKVHDLSDFAFFDHSRHTVGARLECAECHGPVETMTRVRRVYSLTMDWCLGCHRMPPEDWRTDGRPTRGPTHCSTCHR
jgi:hypothetical protein